MIDNKIFIISSLFGTLLATIIIVISQKSQQHLSKSQEISYNTIQAIPSRQQKIIDVSNQYHGRNYSDQIYKNGGLFSQAYQEQQTQINLSQSDLESPYFLIISAMTKRTKLTGEIHLNGQLIQRFNHSQNIIDLSPYLTSGRQIILISGDYTPINDSIMIQLKGKNTQISQETAGSGQLRQQLIIDIQ